MRIEPSRSLCIWGVLMSKKRKGAKAPKITALTRLRRMTKGLIVQWDDNDPLNETKGFVDVTFSHRNPVMNIGAQKTFSGLGGWLLDEQLFNWHITVTGIYNTKPKLTFESRMVDGYCTITDVNELVVDLIKEIRRYGNDSLYLTTRFHLECVGITETRQ